ncbi:MAG: hypothetical protein ABEL97_00720 [Salinibacter sp.]
MARLQRTFSALVLACALLPMSAAAVPADTSDTPEEAAAKAEVLRLLNSGSLEKQERAVRLIGHYAHTDQYGEDFHRLMVTPLQYLVANGRTEPLRIMAVSALYSIGTDPAMRGLQAQVDALNSDRVTRVTKNALAQHAADRTATMP